MNTYETPQELKGEEVKRFLEKSLKLPAQTTNAAQLSKSAIEKVKYIYNN